MIRSIAKFTGLSESDLGDGTAGGVVVALLTLPFRILWGFIYFMIFSWTISRSGFAFFLAIPAMLGLIGYVALVWVIGFKGDYKAIAVSRQLYKHHIAANSPVYNPEAAKRFAQKMVFEAPEEKLYKYELGLAYEVAEEIDRAYDIMTWIAPRVDPNDTEALKKSHSGAHLWLASYYGSEKHSGHLPEDKRAKWVDEHLKLASLTSDSEKPEYVMALLGIATQKLTSVNELTAELEELDEDSPEAKELDRQIDTLRDDSIKLLREAANLRLVTERQLYASVAVVEALKEKGEFEQARIEGRQFINTNIRSARNNADLLPFWLSIVRICILIDDFERAESHIREGFQLAQKPEIRLQLAKLAAQIDVEKSKTYKDMKDQEQFLARLTSLIQAVKKDFQVPLAYNELMYYVDGFESGSEQDFWLRDSILGGIGDDEGTTDPSLPGVLHVVIGLRDILDGEEEAGKNHWETAGQQFPFTAFSINYLIQVYCEDRDLSSERKQELISVAIEMFPQSPKFYMTRGRFLIDDEKYAEALEDFQFAEARIPANVSLCKNILDCYENLNNEEKIKEYEAKIADLELAKSRDQISTGFSSDKLNIKTNKDEE